MRINNKTIRNFINDRSTLIFTSILFLLILFRRRVEELISTILVDNLLSYCKSEFFNDALILLLVAGIIFYYLQRIKKNYLLSWQSLGLIITIVVIYSSYRFLTPIWIFTPFSFWEKLKYLDFIFVIFLMNLGLVISNLIRKKQLIISQPGSFVSDQSIGKSGKDLLGREHYAEEIAKRIELTNYEKSFAIGILGAWGSGKTSFLEMIERNLNKDNKIIIHFYPWYSNSPNAIVKDFFELFQEEISKYSSSLSRQLSNYSDKLIQLDDNIFTKSINQIINFFSTPETVQEQYDEINNKLKEINKQIIIFIDDLDRLDTAEVFEVIRLLRNSANFTNTVFIAAYNRNYILNAIEDINKHNNEFFLEKIFQLELTLSPFESILIREKLINRLEGCIKDEHLHEIKDLILNNYSKQYFIDDYLQTIRDTTRFTNSFVLSQSLLHDEVSILDLFNIELIRFKYPIIYELLYKQKSDFFDTDPTRGDKGKLKLKLAKKDSNASNKYELEEYLYTNSKTVGISKENIQVIIKALNFIFPDTQQYGRSHLSIVYPSHFLKYFALRVLRGSLSETEFSKYRKKSQEEFNSQIYEWVKQGLRYELRFRFEEISEYDNREDFEKIIRAIFYLGSIPSLSPINDYSGYNDNDILKKLSDREKRNVKYFYNGNPDEYKDFVLELFKHAKQPFIFEIDFIFYILDHDISFILTKEELEYFRINYLENYLKFVNKFDSNVWQLFHHCDIIERIPTGSNSYKKTERKNPVAIKLLKNFIERKDLDGYLLAILNSKRHDSDFYSISNSVITLFDSFTGFEKFLDKFDERNHKYLSEFNEFYKLFKEAEYKKPIEYEFKDIPVNNKS